MGAAEYGSTLTDGIFPPPTATAVALFEALGVMADAADENAYARDVQGNAAPKQVSRTTSAPSVVDSPCDANTDRPSTNEI
jgi:hypothetical protein